MDEKKFENFINFEDFVMLNKKMSPKEAIEHLCTYHNTSSEIILDRFMNLREFDEGTVEFRHSVNNGNPCIVMEGRDSNGQFSWNELIDSVTGRPQNHTS